MTNEKEWRDMIFKKLDKVEDKIDSIQLEMNTLKIKVALFSSFIGSLVTFVINKFL